MKLGPSEEAPCLAGSPASPTGWGKVVRHAESRRPRAWSFTGEARGPAGGEGGLAVPGEDPHSGLGSVLTAGHHSSLKITYKPETTQGDFKEERVHFNSGAQATGVFGTEQGPKT